MCPRLLIALFSFFSTLYLFPLISFCRTDGNSPNILLHTERSESAVLVNVLFSLM